MSRSILLTLLALIGIAGCDPSITDSTYNFRLPPDLAHCQVIELRSGDPVGEKYIFLIKCPPGQIPDGYVGLSSKVSQGKTSFKSTTAFVENK